MSKPQVPVLEGWFSTGENPHLLGSRCTSCSTYFFPKESFYCRNPNCASSDFEEVPLSTRGRIWSYTKNCYQPPAPYVAPEPFEPYTIAAVELAEEKMVVLGQLASGADQDAIEVGQEVELVIEMLFEDDEAEHLVCKWKPLA
jgi:uncharacterized OB-fold protein